MTPTAPHVLVQRDEVMVNTLVSDPVGRVGSYRLLAEAFDRILR
ncbi:hypothetical protein [Corynebacterium nuruki]